MKIKLLHKLTASLLCWTLAIPSLSHGQGVANMRAFLEGNQEDQAQEKKQLISSMSPQAQGILRQIDIFYKTSIKDDEDNKEDENKALKSGPSQLERPPNSSEKTAEEKETKASIPKPQGPPLHKRLINKLSGLIKSWWSEDDQGTLQKRLGKELAEFKESWWDPSQDHSSALEELGPFNQELHNTFTRAYKLRKQVWDYLQKCHQGGLGLAVCKNSQELSFVLLEYIDLVYLPMRQMALIMMDFQKEGEESHLSRVDGLIAGPIPESVFDGPSIQALEEDITALSFFKNPQAAIFAQMGLPGAAKAEVPRALRVAQNGHTYTLEHNARKQLDRDIKLILETPAAITYIRALKWSGEKNLISQIEYSKLVLNDSSDIEIPNSCSSKDAGQLPPSIPIQYGPFVGQLEYLNLLMGHGVFTASPFENKEELHLYGISEELAKGITAGSEMQVDEVMLRAQEQIAANKAMVEKQIAYLTFVPGLSIEQGDMYGVLPYEQLEKARFAIEGEYKKEDTPFFDDLHAFNYIYDFIMKKGMGKLQEIISYQAGGLNNASNMPMTTTGIVYPLPANFPLDVKLTEEAAKYFKNAFALWAPDPSQGPETDDLSREGFTQLQVELMEKHNTSDLMSLLTPEIKSKLQDQIIEYDFPPYYSSANMKRFALEEVLTGLMALLQTLDSSEEIGDEANKAMKGIVQAAKKTAVFKKSSRYPITYNLGANFRSVLERILAVLDPYSYFMQTEFFPYKSIASEELKQSWPILREIYHVMLEHEIIQQEQVSQYDYIQEQIYHFMKRGKNPWAILKLSYYLALGEIKKSDELRPLEQYFRIFTKRMGLDRPIAPFYGQSLLARKKDRIEVWRTIETTLDAQNNFLYRTKSLSRPEYNYYDFLQHVATTPVITKDRFVKVTQDLLSRGAFNSNQFSDFLDRADKYFSDPFFASSSELYDIYMTNDVERKMEKMQSFIQRHDIGASYEAKRHILKADFYSKNLLYQELTAQAAYNKKRVLEKSLDETCSMKHNEIEKYRRTFYSLATEQETLASISGAQELPPGVADKIESMPDREWQIIVHSLWLVPSLVIPIILGAMGCGATLGLGCVAMFAGMASFTGWHSWKVLENAGGFYTDSKKMGKDMLKFKDVGLSDQESIDEFERWLIIPILETAMILPIVNIFIRPLRTGATALKQLIKFRKEKALSHLIIHSNFTTELSESKHVLGLASAIDDLHATQKGAEALFNKSFRRQTPIKGIGAKNKSTERITPFHHIEGLPDKDKLIRSLGDTFALYYKNDPKRMHKSFKRFYKPKKLAKHESELAIHKEALKKGDTPQRPSKFQSSILGKTALSLKGQGSRSVKYRKARIRRLNKLIEIQKRMEKVLSNMERAIARGDSIQAIVGRNIEHLAHLQKLPVKLYELPHYAIAQGGPMVRRRVPLYDKMIEGFMVRRIMMAYNNLLNEIVRKEAIKELLGTQPGFLHDNYRFIEGVFRQLTLRQLTLKAESGKLANLKLAEQLAKYEEELASKIKVPRAIRKKHPEIMIGPDKLRQVLFRPDGPSERAIAEAIWNKTKFEDLYRSENLYVFARTAFRELNSIKKGRKRNLDDLDLSFRLAKIVLATRRPEMIQ